MCCHMEEKAVSPNSSLLDEFSPSFEIDIEDIQNCQNPPTVNWISTEDPDQGYVKMEFAAHMPPSIPKVQVHSSNESTVSVYCRFVQAVLSLRPMEGFDFDMGIEQGNSGQSDGPHIRFVLYINSALRHQLMMTKDVQLELLR